MLTIVFERFILLPDIAMIFSFSNFYVGYLSAR